MLPRTIALIAGSVALALTPFVLAQDVRDIKGVLKDIDSKQGTITFRVGAKKNASIKTLNLAKSDLPVTDAAGKSLKLNDLKPGQRVYLTAPGDDVTAIRLRGN